MFLNFCCVLGTVPSAGSREMVLLAHKELTGLRGREGHIKSQCGDHARFEQVEMQWENMKELSSDLRQKEEEAKA